MKKNIFLALFTLISLNLTLAQSGAIDTTHTFQTKKLALNLDGARHAYHPNNEGLLYNLNGGITKEEAVQNKFKKSRGYGIAKKRIGQTNMYQGYIQPDGYYVSQTTPYNRNQPDSSYTKYADAETIPYITLSPAWKARGIKNCDMAFVINLDNGKESAAIFADYRGNDKKMEISLALAQALEIPVATRQSSSYDTTKTVTRYVGIESRRLKVYYFIHSGDGDGKTAEEIKEKGRKLMGRP
ncbi:hypothetical protein GJU43_18960 [Flavobacterium sp. LC2016-23]|uniref:hypothetical protein n=1 Tax=Flavobacterium sp. LC2016-23 TaxID=2666330 RepID=UPI0012AEEEFE|nr:hypothetical protein [Flavobacterium sp. LC2016-23]MRX41373.1 hypothetical protein [Flavobacterium sp. LC2016-23]